MSRSYKHKFPMMLYAERMASGLTGSQLADKLGVTTGFVSMLERGERAPSLELVDSLATISDLYNRKQWMVAGARSHGWEI